MKKWHQVIFPCLKCDKAIQIREFLARADGQMIFTGFCPSCAIMFHYETNAVRTALHCQQADNEPNQPVRPPLTIPPPLLNADDMKFLHDFHIKDEDDGS